MSRKHPDHHRPSSFSKSHPNNLSNNRFTLPPNNRQRPSKSTTHRAHQPSHPFWEAQDDLIAPTASSTSIACLERWARATATFPQSGLGRREDLIVERIERRYGTVTVPRAETFRSARDDLGLRREEGFARDAMHQRKRESEVKGDEGGGKRRKGEREVVDLTEEGESGGEGKGGIIDLTGQDDEDRLEGVDYAQSSEWSWPGSQEDA